jgi:hypothetical protein
MPHLLIISLLYSTIVQPKILINSAKLNLGKLRFRSPLLCTYRTEGDWVGEGKERASMRGDPAALVLVPGA